MPFIIPYHIIPTIPHHTTPHHITSHHTTPHTSHHTTPHHTHHITPHHITHFTPHHTTTSHTSHHITPHHTTPHHITSHHTTHHTNTYFSVTSLIRPWTSRCAARNVQHFVSVFLGEYFHHIFLKKNQERIPVRSAKADLTEGRLQNHFLFDLQFLCLLELVYQGISRNNRSILVRANVVLNSNFVKIRS